MDGTDNSFWKWLSDKWAILTTGYFFISLLSFAFYYLDYGVNMLTYCDITELITIWFASVFTTTIFTFIPSFLALWFINATREADNINYHYYHIIPRVAALGLYIYAILRYVFNINNLPFLQIDFIRHAPSLWIALLIFFMLIFTVIVSVFKGINLGYKQIKCKERCKQEVYRSHICIALIVFLFFMLGPLEIKSTQFEFTPTTITKCITDKDTIVSNFNYRYVGKTKDYIVFYNVKERNSDIYSIKNMISIKTINVNSQASTIKKRK